MLIFIGVLFTCVIPLFLYVNEVNNTYDRTVVEMKNFDEDRARELLDVYAYPLGPSDTRICLYIKNKCPLSVQVIRVWINDQNFTTSLQVPGMTYNITSPIDISVMLPTQGSKSFKVKVTTTRGNTFSSLTNPLYYSQGSGWSSGGNLAIHIVLTKQNPGTEKFTVLVTKVSTGTPPVICNEQVTMLGNTQSYFKRVDVPEPATYHVKITRQRDTLVITDQDVQVTWEIPSQWVYAYS